MTSTLDGVGVRLEEDGVIVAWVLTASHPVSAVISDDRLIVETTEGTEWWSHPRVPMLSVVA